MLADLGVSDLLYQPGKEFPEPPQGQDEVGRFVPPQVKMYPDSPQVTRKAADSAGSSDMAGEPYVAPVCRLQANVL